jgi:hypothetical protein
MSNYSVEVGSKPALIGQYVVSIDTSTAITLPTSAQGVTHAGVLELILSVETQDARLKFDGTAPAAGSGILLKAPGLITIRGAATISAIRIIGVAAGGVINYGFTWDALV